MKNKKKYLCLLGLFSLAFLLLFWAVFELSKAPGQLVRFSGWVVDSAGLPVEGATVRFQGTEISTLSDALGGFVLLGPASAPFQAISAWKEGYYCARLKEVKPSDAPVNLVLRPVQNNDNPAYEWVLPVGENSCYSCKSALTQVWLDADAHGKSAKNVRFLTLYNGSDITGRLSPATRYIQTRDYGRLPLPPDPSQPYYGPGYRLDFPNSAGNCAACHIPSAALAAPYGVDPNQVSGADAFGIHCDFCHKIAAVRLDPATGLPLPSMPGVLSLEVRRPFPTDAQRYQLFFGTFDDDNVPEEDTRLSLLTQSQFCAPCHYGVFWDTVVYNSFGEWLSSPYSDPQTGRTCQQCHTPAPTYFEGALLTNVAPGKGGIERDPAAIHAHTFSGASSIKLLQNALSMQVTAQREGQRLAVDVTLVNDQTGHSIPTDSPLRQMILVVEARSASGQALEQRSGETVPAWAGVGDVSLGNYAGLPGKGFARILAELWTEISPTAAYWNPTREVSDHRLAALASDTSHYEFAAPEGGGRVLVRLWYRRAFRSLAEQKGWTDADILMEEQVIGF